MQKLHLDLFNLNRPQGQVKMIQFGEGNFLRAFVDWIVWRLNKADVGFNASVILVQPIENGLTQKLAEQDGLYTVITNGLVNGQLNIETDLINLFEQIINPYTQPQAYFDLATDPAIRFVVSNTTEAGISLSGNDQLNAEPAVSFPAKVTQLLFKRFNHFNGDISKGLIFLPCELIEQNGTKLKALILELAEKWNLPASFAQWVEQSCLFANTLVDRIVPGYPKKRESELNEKLGYIDEMMVEAESFHFWVIEGDEKIKQEFPADKSGLNVLFTDNLTPYRTRKVRILNGGHTTLVPVAYLAGLEAVRQSVEDENIGVFLRKAIFDEIVPTLTLPHQELTDFANDVIDRFRNPFIHHLLITISLNSWSKYETRVLPSLIQFHRNNGTLPNRLVFSLACLTIFYKGNFNGQAIQLNDAQFCLDKTNDLWFKYDNGSITLDELAQAILDWPEVWKLDLNEIDGLKHLLSKYIGSILELGVVNSLKANELI